MGRLIVNNAMTVDGAFEAPSPTPDGWLVLDADTQQASLDMWLAADAMLIGRRTYEGLSRVWPQLAEVPGQEAFARRMNTMPKYVASRTLTAPLTWNATLIDGELTGAVRELKQRHDGDIMITGAGEVAHALLAAGLVDELRFLVSPYVWPAGPRILGGAAPARLDLVSTTTYPSGAVQLRYRPATTTTG